jgi:hypothetical protein
MGGVKGRNRLSKFGDYNNSNELNYKLNNYR